jgi:glycosyltransferase involved in cell wall biosynthesis
MKACSENNLVVHAPNVHQGGGLVLLRELLQVDTLPLQQVFLDARIQRSFSLGSIANVQYVQRSLLARLSAEWRLCLTAKSSDILICFHGLPPLFPCRALVVIFVQNRLLIEGSNLAGYPLPVKARLCLERIWSRMLQRRCSRYIVQTPSMAALLKRWLWREVPISVVPFMPATFPQKKPSLYTAQRKFDFVYVASGEAHKNHRNLIESWRLLAVAGFRPSLALTLDTNLHPALCDQIAKIAASNELAVTNLGSLSSESVDALYQIAGAMIYPSTTESFGLPLVEAARWGFDRASRDLRSEFSLVDRQGG